MIARRSLFIAASMSLLIAGSAHASFHLMQIEQVIGGVNGDANAQAIQLRMRSSGQNLVQGLQLVVHDAAGNNPIVVATLGNNVPNATGGSRILIATPAFLPYLPGVTPDFMMTARIPVAYLAGGSLTYETGGSIFWRLSWGNYTGPGTGLNTNDADGNFNPPFPGQLPSTTHQALLFRFPATALSTNNAADYQITPGDAVFTNNAGQSGTVTKPSCVVIDPGIDLFTTPPGGSTYDDFGAMPIPAGFFDPGSEPFDGVIQFYGDPISPSSQLGPTDTIVRRNAGASLGSPGSQATIPIEIVALHLQSVQPFTVRYTDAHTEVWNVHVCLSSVVAQPQGQMTIKASDCACSEGGTFTSTLPVMPRLIFTRTNPPAERVLDYGTLALQPIIFTSNRGHWMPTDPGGLGLITVPAGLSVDHDCNASTPSVTLPGSSNFFAGVRTVHCDPADCGSPSSHEKRLTQEESQQAAHGILPAQACSAGDNDNDGVCDDADNCPNLANPGQQDQDDDGRGDICDNCELVANPCQEDINVNGVGDRCETLGASGGLAGNRVMLSPPVPNPATGALSYTISLPREARARIAVYDVRGRLVRNLLDQTLPAGRHSFTWNPVEERGRIASGTYYLRLDADGVRQSRKFTLVR